MPWSEHLQILSSNSDLCMRLRRRSMSKKILIFNLGLNSLECALKCLVRYKFKTPSAALCR
jgi:hypothetical protein